MKTGSALITVALTAIFSMATPATADPFGVGGSNTGWLADNHDHDYCWSTNFTWNSLRLHAGASMRYLNSSTNFSGGSLQSCNSGTDIHFQRFNTTAYRGLYQCDAYRGLYQCDDRNGNVCDNADIRISSNTGTLPANERRKTICHEVGHSAGATHHSSGWGCMMSGTSTSRTYVQHTLDHMDDLEVEDS